MPHTRKRQPRPIRPAAHFLSVFCCVEQRHVRFVAALVERIRRRREAEPPSRQFARGRLPSLALSDARDRTGTGESLLPPEGEASEEDEGMSMVSFEVSRPVRSLPAPPRSRSHG